jgi:hypothetical protein
VFVWDFKIMYNKYNPKPQITEGIIRNKKKHTHTQQNLTLFFQLLCCRPPIFTNLFIRIDLPLCCQSLTLIFSITTSILTYSLHPFLSSLLVHQTQPEQQLPLTSLFPVVASPIATTTTLIVIKLGPT